MGNIKWIFVLYSLGAMLSMALIGIAVALRSIPLVYFRNYSIICSHGIRF